MFVVKIKISDEPRIIATAIRHPFQVVLSFAGDSTDVVTGILDGDNFIQESADPEKTKKVVDVLIKNKINFSVESKN